MPSPVVQLWKIADEAANKNGDCKTVYTVKEKTSSNNQTSSQTINQPIKSKKKYEVKETYIGEWSKNLRHGFGRLSNHDSLYEGQFVAGKKSGDGTLYIIDQSINQSNTQSISQSINQLRQVYTGEWKNDQRNGRGIQFHTDGARHEGTFLNDVPHGYGTFFFINGDTLTGEWKFGHQNGFGSLVKRNGDFFEGTFLRGKREGSGIYFYAEKNKIFDGEWVDDSPITGVMMTVQEYLKLQSNNQSIDQSNDRPSTSRGASASFIQTLLTASAIELSINQSINQSNDQSIDQSNDQSINQSNELPILRLANADEILSNEIERILIDRSIIRSLPPIHHGTFDLFSDQSINQTIKQIYSDYLMEKQTESGIINQSINLSIKPIDCLIARTLLIDCWDKCKLLSNQSNNQSNNQINVFSTGPLSENELDVAYHAMGKINQPINQSNHQSNNQSTRVISPPVGSNNESINQSNNQSMMRLNEFIAVFWLCVQTRRANETRRASNQSNDQSNNQSMNQTINQSINQSMDQTSQSSEIKTV